MCTERDVVVCEVGLRDGLQNLDRVLDLGIKKQWIEAEAAAGVSEIEVGSFVNFQRLPQMADTADLVAFAKTISGLNVTVLVPNAHGAKLAIQAGVDRLSVPFSASESHSRDNVNRSHQQMIVEVASIRDMINALPEARRPLLEVGISTAFGCTIEGAIAQSKVVSLAQQLVAVGADEIGLADTVGMANPMMVRNRVRSVKDAIGRHRLTTLHLHNTRGLGLANAAAALEEGITTLDASLAGLGGCPSAPGATGNIVTEDLVFMLESMGFRTGIEIDRLMQVRECLAQHVPDIPLRGFLAVAGLPMAWTPEILA